jgi:quinol-cytochrome oxidoreductase complex cytochrome b subunit
VYFAPNVLGHPDNYIAANPMVTPTHIVPEWYFLPFYAILRSVPNKLGGVVLLLGAILILLVLPFIANPRTRSSQFIPLYRFMFWLIFFNCILLGILGGKPIEPPYLMIGQVATAFYFLSFLVFIPLIRKFEADMWKIDDSTHHGIKRKEILRETWK